MLLRGRYLWPAAWAKIIRKSLLTDNRIFFPEDMVYEDHYWLPLLSVYAESVYMTDMQLYHYFWNPHSTVLSRNQEYHLDCLTIQMLKWNDYRKRGLLREYREEMEYDLLWYVVTSFMKTIISFWDEPPFAYFRLEQEFIKGQIPYPEKNPYIGDLSDINKLLLDVLYSSIHREEFYQISSRIKALLSQ